MRRFATVRWRLAGLVSAGLLLHDAEPRAKPIPGFPDDVIAFIGRRAACRQWSAKAGADPAYGAVIAGTMQILGCAAVARDEAVLLERYADDPRALEALAAAWVKVVRRVPVWIGPGARRPDLGR